MEIINTIDKVEAGNKKPRVKGFTVLFIILILIIIML